MSSTQTLTIYQIVPSYTLNDVNQLQSFVNTLMSSNNVPIYSVTYDSPSNTVTITTSESASSATTQSQLQDVIGNQYPNPPAIVTGPNSQTSQAISSSVYGYLPSTNTQDGNEVMTTNTSLMRNMYYNNLVVAQGVTCYSNGWRICVANTLTLNGTICCNGGNANGGIPGSAPQTLGTTYLGTGSPGASGITTSGNGLPGVNAPFCCTGGKPSAAQSGSGGSITGGLVIGGAAGSYLPISTIDGGIQILGVMPTAFVGRLPNSTPYLMGGVGGGSGSASKASAKTVLSGAGGAGGGFIIIACKTITGSGLIQARGGNGGNPIYTGTTPTGVGAGGGGSGGGVILIAQSLIPSSIQFDVSGGLAGTNPVGSATCAYPGATGNVFIVNL